MPAESLKYFSSQNYIMNLFDNIIAKLKIFMTVVKGVNGLPKPRLAAVRRYFWRFWLGLGNELSVHG